MNVFDFRNRLVDDYASYIKSFIQIQDKRINDYVEENLESGLLWPDPLIQLNPSFESGDWIDDFVKKGTLHEVCSRIFRIKQEAQGEGKPLRLHRHQADAINAAKTGNNYGNEAYYKRIGERLKGIICWLVPHPMGLRIFFQKGREFVKIIFSNPFEVNHLSLR